MTQTMATAPPCPPDFFDTLEAMENPFKNRVVSVSHLYADSPENAVEDYQYASEFIYSYRGSPDTFNTYRRELNIFALVLGG